MRRVAVIVALGAALVVPSAPAFATVHPLACSERSSAPADSPATTQDPPGITTGGVDQSSATEAQPVLAVEGNPGVDAALANPEGC
jgi:hypothetical protein